MRNLKKIVKPIEVKLRSKMSIELDKIPHRYGHNEKSGFLSKFVFGFLHN